MLRRPELSDFAGGNLAGRLFRVLVFHQLGEAEEYHLSNVELRDALTVAPARLREHVAWRLWRLQGDKPSQSKPSREQERSARRPGPARGGAIS